MFATDKKGGEGISVKRMGRPPSENPLSIKIFARIDKATKEKLDNCMKTLKVSCSDVIRLGIEKVSDDLT